MAISKDLFLSILAMDAYNRRYNTGLEDEAGANDGLGNAKISFNLEDADLAASAVDASR